MIPENASLQEIQEIFSNDQFATKACGARIVSGERGKAVCELTVEAIHRNAMGGIMGGAIFTLADYALAIACNIGETPTVLVSGKIDYLNSSQGEKLIATCEVEKSGRSLGFYTIEVRDDKDVLIAKMLATCSRKPA